MLYGMPEMSRNMTEKLCGMHPMEQIRLVPEQQNHATNQKMTHLNRNIHPSARHIPVPPRKQHGGKQRNHTAAGAMTARRRCIPETRRPMALKALQIEHPEHRRPHVAPPRTRARHCHLHFVQIVACKSVMLVSVRHYASACEPGITNIPQDDRSRTSLARRREYWHFPSL